VHDSPCIPRPLRRGVLGGCVSQVFPTSMGLRLLGPGSAPPCPLHSEESSGAADFALCCGLQVCSTSFRGLCQRASTPASRPAQAGAWDFVAAQLLGGWGLTETGLSPVSHARLIWTHSQDDLPVHAPPPRGVWSHATCYTIAAARRHRQGKATGTTGLLGLVNISRTSRGVSPRRLTSYLRSEIRCQVVQQPAEGDGGDDHIAGDRDGSVQLYRAPPVWLACDAGRLPAVPLSSITGAMVPVTVPAPTQQPRHGGDHRQPQPAQPQFSILAHPRRLPDQGCQQSPGITRSGLRERPGTQMGFWTLRQP